MTTNSIKIILRQLTRNKSFSVINLMGLITGLTVGLFITQFVWFEYSFEQFNKNADRTYSYCSSGLDPLILQAKEDLIIIL